MITDIIIPLGLRSIVSLAGILMIIAGVWYTDRTWDEKGSAVYAKAKKKAKKTEKVIIPKKELDAMFPFPILFILGWVVFASSYIFSIDGSATININIFTIGAILFSLILASVASIPMADAVLHRKKDKKMKLSMMFLISWIGLTVMSGYSTNMGTLSWVLGGIGAACIIMSMKLLWKYRKMGDSWEKEGRPNPNPIVYNMGGPLFIFGWFLFWVSMSSTTGGTLITGLPIYFNLRTAIAFITGLGMVPIVMMLDYAHDEGGKYVGLGTSGAHFGRFFEGPIPFFTMWTLFGAASFLTVNNLFATPTLRLWLILFNAMLIAVIAGGFIQTALYKGNMPLKKKLSMGFLLLFLTLAINIGLNSKLTLYLALAGATLIVAGQKTVFGDRKRGDYWMINKKDNPNPIVYSLGEIFFTAGWILFSLAMSLPKL